MYYSEKLKYYSEKLKDPRWQKKQLEVMERDGWECTNCGDKEKTLHVHHKKYLKGKDPWDYDNDLLETLCEPCHEREGKKPGYVKEINEFLEENCSADHAEAILMMLWGMLNGDMLDPAYLSMIGFCCQEMPKFCLLYTSDAADE